MTNQTPLRICAGGKDALKPINFATPKKVVLSAWQQSYFPQLMKLFIFMLTLLSSIVSQGGTVNLAWDWTSDPSGIYFKLFKKQLASVYDYQSPEWTGTSTTASATINTGTNYCFVVRAARTSPVAESPDSNEVCLQKPKVKPPTGFRLADFKMTVDLANNLALVNAVYTNDFGYHITSQFYQTALLNQKELEDDQQ